mgnify:CR=1 FL=1
MDNYRRQVTWGWTYKQLVTSITVERSTIVTQLLWQFAHRHPMGECVCLCFFTSIYLHSYYIHTCIHMCVDVYVCMYVCMCVVCVGLLACMYVYCLYIHVCMYVCMCVCMYAFFYVCMCICMYVMSRCTCMHVYIYMYVCVCMYRFACMHIDSCVSKIWEGV